MKRSLRMRVKVKDSRQAGEAQTIRRSEKAVEEEIWITKSYINNELKKMLNVIINKRDRKEDRSLTHEKWLHPAKDRCEFFFHYDYGPLILAGINFKESISSSNGFTANINLQCNKDVAMESYFRKILNQQPPTDIIIGGDLACIEDLYSLLPPHSPSSNCPATIILTFCVVC